QLRESLQPQAKDSPGDYGAILHGLALVYLNQKDYAQSEPLLAEALKLQTPLGLENSQLIDTRTSYARLLRETNREQQAQAFEAQTAAKPAGTANAKPNTTAKPNGAGLPNGTGQPNSAAKP